jgi:hypothetical protein
MFDACAGVFLTAVFTIVSPPVIRLTLKNVRCAFFDCPRSRLFSCRTARSRARSGELPMLRTPMAMFRNAFREGNTNPGPAVSYCFSGSQALLCLIRFTTMRIILIVNERSDEVRAHCLFLPPSHARSLDTIGPVVRHIVPVARFGRQFEERLLRQRRQASQAFDSQRCSKRPFQQRPNPFCIDSTPACRS